MVRSIALVLLVAGCGSCMEMRETVERMVMVRTTGSDLQPAATGFIYKKESDGPESVVKMGESEVMEHLTKLYEQPKSFAAPIPVAAGPFYAKEDEEKSTPSETKVIPVVENQNTAKVDHIDGIANEDYGKIFGEYAADYGNYNSDFDDYLKSLGYFDHEVYHDDVGGKEYDSQNHNEHGDKERKGYGSNHHYEKGGAGDYHDEKYASFKISGEGGHKKDYDDTDAAGRHYANTHAYKKGDHSNKAGHSKGEEIGGFRKLFENDEYKKGHDFYDGDAIKGGFHKFADGHAHHGSDAGGFKNGGSRESGHGAADFGKGGFNDDESGEEHEDAVSSDEGGESTHHLDGDLGAEGGKYHGKSYGYEVKH